MHFHFGDEIQVQHVGGTIPSGPQHAFNLLSVKREVEAGAPLGFRVKQPVAGRTSKQATNGSGSFWNGSRKKEISFLHFFDDSHQDDCD